MSIFKRLSKQTIKNEYTHYALAYGIYPVYINLNADVTSVAVRNWWPDFMLTVFDCIAQSIMWITGAEQIFAFKITGKINI